MNYKLFFNVNVELGCKIERMAVLVALICLTTTAMAQIDPALTRKYSGRFPKLPPLKCDLDVSSFTHSLSNVLTMSLGSVQNADTEVSQSIMFRRKENVTMPHFHIKAGIDVMRTGDAWKGVRDQIVRDRRKDEGRPLPPPTPRMW